MPDESRVGFGRRRTLRITLVLFGTFALAGTVLAVSRARTPVDPRGYAHARAAVAAQRAELRRAYESARTEHERKRVLVAAADTLVDAVGRELIPFWLGTRYDFHGTSEVPRQGEIACGYFVTTVLRDAGLRIERARMAQVASETMIRSLVEPARVKRLSHESIRDVVATIRRWGPGVYVVGLDYHTGFVVSDARGIHFVHSAPGTGVVREPARRSYLLAASDVHVLGKLEGDELVRKWLFAEAIPTRSRT